MNLCRASGVSQVNESLRPAPDRHRVMAGRYADTIWDGGGVPAGHRSVPERVDGGGGGGSAVRGTLRAKALPVREGSRRSRTNGSASTAARCSPLGHRVVPSHCHRCGSRQRSAEPDRSYPGTGIGRQSPPNVHLANIWQRIGPIARITFAGGHMAANGWRPERDPGGNGRASQAARAALPHRPRRLSPRRRAEPGQLGLTVRKQSEQYTGRSIRGLKGTWAWFPHELQTTAKYSRTGRSSPRS